MRTRKQKAAFQQTLAAFRDKRKSPLKRLTSSAIRRAQIKKPTLAKVSILDAEK